MKCRMDSLNLAMSMSHPARGAWIEMEMLCKELDDIAGRTPQGVRGLKSSKYCVSCVMKLSHPARGAWIEIFRERVTAKDIEVAPRKGCVD